MSNNKPRSNKPYDPNNSFVKKVASRVSGLIPKSTSWLSSSLSGWFSPTTNSEQGSSNTGDQVNHEEDHFEDALERPPPSKRFKLTANQQYAETYPLCQNVEEGDGGSRLVSVNCLDTSAIPGPSGLGARSSGFVASTPAVTSVGHLEPKANGDDCSESGESTSGCSSLEPQMNRGAASTQNQSRQSDSLSPRKRLLDDKLNYSYLNNSRSLYLDRTSNSRGSQPVGRRNNPSFCVNTFGTPLFGQRGNVNDLILNSPFYTGRTTYGGASSASLRRSLGSASLSSSPANSDKLRHTIKVKPDNTQSAEDTSMSQTAKRILATLEQFSTPILDAKRIPVAQEPVLATLGSRKRSRPDNSGNSQLVLEQPNVPKRTSNKPMHWAKGAPNTSQLTIPVTPDTLVVRRRELAPETISTAKPTQSPTNTDTYKIRTENENTSSTRNTLKMRPPTTYMRPRSSDEDPKDPEMPSEVKLPDVPLPISTLPKFDISVPAPKPDANKSSIPSPGGLSFGSTATKKPLSVSSPITSFTTVPSLTVSSQTASSEAPFSFSSPIKVSSSSKDHPLTPINNFNFSNPLPASMNFSVPTVHSVKARPKVGIDSPKQSDGFLGGLKPASELKTGSVMDILGKGSKDTSKNNSLSSNGNVSLMDKFKPAAGTWECDKCLIRNKSDLAKCAACTNPREAKTQAVAKSDATDNKLTPTTTDLKTDSDFGAQFKMAQGMWECSTCMVRNKEVESKCVSCTTPKPGTAPAKPATPASGFSGWGDKFKPPSNTWECSVCMVRNGPELSACQSCTTKKPGASETLCPPPMKSSWGDQFKKPEGSWTCNDCMVTNKSTDLKCIACSSQKPGSEGSHPKSSEGTNVSFGIPPASGSGSTAPAFSFGIPKDVKEANEKEKSNVSSSTGFKFGESKSQAPVAAFSFGIPPSSAPSVPATPISTTSNAAMTSNVASTALPVFSASTGLTTSGTTSGTKPLFGLKTGDGQVAKSSLPTEVPKPVFSFGAPVASDGKSNAAPLFAFSKPASVSSQPASSSASPLGGKRKFGDDAPSSSAPPIKFGVSSNDTIAPSQAKPVATSTSSVSSTSGPVIAFSVAASSTSSSGKSFLGASVTSTGNAQNVVDAAKAPPAIFSVTSPTSSSATKPVLAFGLGTGAPKDESVSSTWKQPPPTNAASIENSKSNSANNAAKPAFSFGSTVSSSGMAFGSNASSGTATFSFGASTDKTASPSKPTFGQPSGSGTLFGSGPNNMTNATPTFGSPSSTGFVALTSSPTVSQTFQSSHTIAPTFGAPSASPFASFGSVPEGKKPAFSFNPSEPKKTGFSFSDDKKPNFSFGSSNEDSKKPTFSFNAPATTTTTAQNTLQPAGVFTFGSSAVAPASTANGPAKSGFSFGGNQPTTFPTFNPQPSSSTPGFSFGSSAAPPAFGDANNTPASGATPFGANAGTAFSSSNTFNFNLQQSAGVMNFAGTNNAFGAQSQPPAFPFSETKPVFNFSGGAAPSFLATPLDGSAPGSSATRVLKKAVRRSKR